MSRPMDGNAVVWCQGAFGTTNGKTAHGLVRRTRRYRILSVLDESLAGSEAGEVLDGRTRGIPILAGLPEALEEARSRGLPVTHFVVGLAPDGGVLPERGRRDVLEAIRSGLNVDCGLHEFLSEDEEIRVVAEEQGVTIRDIRKPPHRSRLHFFSGKIEEVDSVVLALLGTDSAVGKRTTAWVLVDALREAGFSAELVGTGQTAWMQGARYSLILDSLINDFVSGEIEHAVWSAWNEARPDFIIIEGQGSLMNPAYPGGFEILAAGRPRGIIMQHAPARKEYDGFPGYPLHPLARQIQVAELLSDKPVLAVTLNHEGIEPEKLPQVARQIEEETGLVTEDVLVQGADRVLRILEGMR